MLQDEQTGSCKCPELRLPPLGEPELEQLKAKAVAIQALGRYAVPAEVLNGHPRLDAASRDLSETHVQFCVLIGCEGGVPPAENDAPRFQTRT